MPRTASPVTKPAEAIRVGDVILPPAREMSLWMRRHIQEHGLSESALYLTVTAIIEGAPDKRGRWIIVRSEQAREWALDTGRASLSFSFKARPKTMWPVIVECAA